MAEKEQSFEEAVTADWQNAFRQDIASMSPVQKFALKKAWDDVEKQNTSAANDFEKKVARMGNDEFNRLVADVTYDASRATQKMK